MRTSQAEPKPTQKAPRRVAIVYQVLHHFREPVFRALRDHAPDRISYTFFAAATNTLDSNKTIPPERADLPAERGGLPWTFVENVSLPGGLLWQRGVLRIAWGEEFDAIVFLGNVHYLSTWIGALLARLRGKRVLMWGHGLNRPETGIRWLVRRLFYRIPHAHLLYGHRARALLVDRGFDPKRLHVVYNSLDYDSQKEIREGLLAEERQGARKRLFQNPDLPILSCIGRIQKRKKIDLLLDAAARLAESGRPVNLLIIGDGEERPNLERIAKSMGIAENTCFYGACYEETEIARLLDLSAICVCPGDTGLTVVHAMAYGLPVITHDNLDAHGPEVELIVPGETGDLYDATLPATLVETLEAWLDRRNEDPDLRERCIAAIEGRYTPGNQARLISDHLLEELGGRHD